MTHFNEILIPLMERLDRIEKLIDYTKKKNLAMTLINKKIFVLFQNLQLSEHYKGKLKPF